MDEYSHGLYSVTKPSWAPTSVTAIAIVDMVAATMTNITVELSLYYLQAIPDANFKTNLSSPLHEVDLPLEIDFAADHIIQNFVDRFWPTKNNHPKLSQTILDDK